MNEHFKWKQFIIIKISKMNANCYRPNLNYDLFLQIVLLFTILQTGCPLRVTAKQHTSSFLCSIIFVYNFMKCGSW
jgi:hypothetical protein